MKAGALLSISQFDNFHVARRQMAASYILASEQSTASSKSPRACVEILGGVSNAHAVILVKSRATYFLLSFALWVKRRLRIFNISECSSHTPLIQR